MTTTTCMPRDWCAGKGQDEHGDPAWFAWSPGSGIVVRWYGGAYADMYTGRLVPQGSQDATGGWVRTDRYSRRGVSVGGHAWDTMNLWDYERDIPRIPRTTRGFLSAVRAWARDGSAA